MGCSASSPVVTDQPGKKTTWPSKQDERLLVTSIGSEPVVIEVDSEEHQPQDDDGTTASEAQTAATPPPAPLLEEEEKPTVTELLQQDQALMQEELKKILHSPSPVKAVPTHDVSDYVGELKEQITLQQGIVEAVDSSEFGEARLLLEKQWEMADAAEARELQLQQEMRRSHSSPHSRRLLALASIPEQGNNGDSLSRSLSDHHRSLIRYDEDDDEEELSLVDKDGLSTTSTSSPTTAATYNSL